MLSFLHSFLDTDSRPTTSTSFPFGIAFLICLLSFFILLGGLSALSQIDFPIIQYIRATPNQTLEKLGQIGNRLGHGSTLVLLSVFALGVGYMTRQLHLKQIGIQSLLAHGGAGLITQILKHSIGRPRPRLTHQEHWQIGPSFQSGLDAFPSGHSSASFAVAAVLARHFPGYSTLIYGSAAFVAFSRVVKGSHFPSDACAGALLGYVIGYVLSKPLRSWQTSFLQALSKGLPMFVIGIGVFWIAVQSPDMEILYYLILGGGILVTAVGYGIRIRAHIADQALSHQVRLATSSLLIALGLALCTGSFLLTSLAALSAVVWWIVQSHQFSNTSKAARYHDSRNFFVTRIREILLAAALIIAISMIYAMRGLIPLI